MQRPLSYTLAVLMVWSDSGTVVLGTVSGNGRDTMERYWILLWPAGITCDSYIYEFYIMNEAPQAPLSWFSP